VIRRILVGVLALLSVLGSGLVLYLWSSLPQTAGRLVLRGPKAEIRIERDADGVPLIDARDDDGACAHAEQHLGVSVHYRAVEVWDDERLVARVEERDGPGA